MTHPETPSVARARGARPPCIGSNPSIATTVTWVGARFVSVLYWDQHVKRSRLQHAPDESLSFVPDWWERHVAECVERRGAYIVVWGDPAPDLLDDVDPERAGRDHMPLTASMFAMA